MDSVTLVCAGCQTRLKVPATLAPGKKAKCPKCSQVIEVPMAAADGGYEASNQETAAGGSATPASRKACPYCGEQILREAVKCRHCGEFLDPARQPAGPRTRGATPTGSELNPAEYVVGTLFCPVGIIIGLFWKLRKQAKATEMLKVSALSNLIVVVAALLFWQYYWREAGNLPTASVGPMPPVVPFVPGDEFFPDGEPPQGVPPGGITPPDPHELAKQPPDIQRAIRATVCILTGPGVGTGVIIQQQGARLLVVTNRHVVDALFAASHGMAQTSANRLPQPTVKFVTNEDKPGKIVWTAPDEIDLALLEVDCPAGIAVANWQEATDVHIGDQVFAVGNPAGLGWTTTFGKVSAFRDHEYGSRKLPVIQTDTRIGPGNSGGGLYTQKGELIGINTFVVASSRSNAGETGLGFAIRQAVLLDLKPAPLKLMVPGGSP